ncbi:MAG: CPBP family intramembrane glutamic endopeptidase [Methylocystaceae bacterium]
MRRQLYIYLALAFIFSWSLAALFYLAGGRLNSPYAGPILIFYMFGPFLAAIITQKLMVKKEIVAPLAISFKLNKWFWLAWLLPPVLAFTTLGITLLFPGVSFSSDMAGMFARYQSLMSPEQYQQMQQQINHLPVHPIWLILAQGLIAGATVNALAAFGEELGWRGFLYSELKSIGFWRSSFIIGLVWGIWHAPLIIQGYNYPQHPLLGVLMMTIWCMLLSPVFSFIRLKTQSVIGASLFHGTLNGTVSLALVLIRGGNDLTTGLLGLPGFITLAVVNLGIYWYQYKHPFISN